jgi:hypothetical protein
MSLSNRLFRMKKANLFEGRKKNERGEKKKGKRFAKCFFFSFFITEVAPDVEVFIETR